MSQTKRFLLSNGEYDYLHFDDDYIEETLKNGVILRRIGGGGGGLYTNVPHNCCHHSPSGFEWGYPGSGPADLALCILDAILELEGYIGERVDCWRGKCFQLAWRLHQRFKFEFITPLPQYPNEVIPYDKIVEWITENKKEIAA